MFYVYTYITDIYNSHIIAKIGISIKLRRPPLQKETQVIL
jgi:hypothetical protein